MGKEGDEMTKIKWGISILFILIYGYLISMYVYEYKIGAFERAKMMCHETCTTDRVEYEYHYKKIAVNGEYIGKLILTTMVGVAIFVGIGMVEEREKKPRELSFFFFLHIAQIIIIALLALNTLMDEIDDLFDGVLFGSFLFMVVGYIGIGRVVLHSNQYHKYIWHVEGAIFYVALWLFSILGGLSVTETPVRFLTGNIYLYFFIPHLLTWVAQKWFPKSATFAQGVLLISMIIIGLVDVLWVFIFENLM